MKNLQFGFAFLLAFFASSFTVPSSHSVHQLPPAQVDYFLKLQGIDGEATVMGQPGWIELESVALGAYSATVSRKTTSVSSPKLMLFCAQGKHLDQVILQYKSDPNSGTYMKVVLKDVMVTSFQTSASDGSGIPMESFSISYKKMIRR